MTARLGEPLTAEQNARAWKTALDPKGEWMPAVLQAADTRLTQLRGGGVPDAGGLVIATDHTTAKAYAALLRRIAGEEPVVVLSDDPKASGRIAEFARTNERWLVAVRMVSEGVDVPRLAVGVYATSASTPLFFAQAVGRFVRSRRPGETASVFLPERAVAAARWPASSRCSATTSSASRTGRRRAGRTTSSRRPTAPRTSRASRRRRSSRSSADGRARPGDLRRVVLRHRGGRGHGRGAGLPRAARAARARPGAGAAAPAPERAARPRGGVGRARGGGPGAVPVAGPRVPAATSAWPSGSRSSGASSTPSSPRTTTARASRTGPSTAICGSTAGGPRRPWPRSSRSRSASPRCGPGADLYAECLILNLWYTSHSVVSGRCRGRRRPTSRASRCSPERHDADGPGVAGRGGRGAKRLDRERGPDARFSRGRIRTAMIAARGGRPCRSGSRADGGAAPTSDPAHDDGRGP